MHIFCCFHPQAELASRGLHMYIQNTATLRWLLPLSEVELARLKE